MELRQLKYFIKAAELQNFTEASGLLFITQSTLSQQIRQLEDELGTPLFDRLGKRVRLTEAGRLFLPYAQKTAKDAQDGKNILKDLMNIETGAVSVGVTYGLMHVLTKALEDFSSARPRIRLQVTFGTTAELLTQLEQGIIDMALSFEPVQKSDVLISEKLFSSSLALIAHKTHPCAANKQVSIKKLENLPLILPSVGYGIRNIFDKVVEKHKTGLEVQMEVNDINMLLQLVNTGKWCTVLMGSSVSQYPELKAIKITGGSMDRDATVTWLANVYQKKAALLLVECLHRHAEHFQFS